MYLSLSVPKLKNKSVDLVDLIGDFLKIEKFDGDGWTCP